MLHHFDGKRSNFAPYGFTCEVWEPQRMLRPDRHDEIEINFVDQGGLIYLLGGQRITVQPRTVVMFWGAIPHEVIHFSDVTYYYVTTVPFNLFLQWNPPEALLTRLILGELLSEAAGSRIRDDGLLFQQWSQDLENPNPRFAMVTAPPAENDSAKRPSGFDSSTSLGKAELMACFIARNYQTRIQIKDIAEVVELHPDYASTLFRQTFGTTLTSLITKHRVAEAQRRLLTTDESITNIAFESGFDSLTRFNRAFKEMAGVTPREYRKHREWVTAEALPVQAKSRNSKRTAGSRR